MYMIVEITFGKILPIGGQGNRGDFPDSAMTATLTRAGSDMIRVCVFHLGSKVAAGKVGLAHGARGLGVDFIGGDANMVLYRAAGRNQEPMDIRGGIYRSTLDYFQEGEPEVLPNAPPSGTARFVKQSLSPEAV